MYLRKPVKKIAIVILNWNGNDFLEKFLPVVIRYSNSLSRIVIIDNSSSDNSISFLTQHFPEIDIVQLDKNYGFTGGYNRGLKGINEEYYVLLNSDVEVTENWLEPLVTFMDNHPDAAAWSNSQAAVCRQETYCPPSCGTSSETAAGAADPSR